MYTERAHPAKIWSWTVRSCWHKRRPVCKTVPLAVTRRRVMEDVPRWWAGVCNGGPSEHRLNGNKKARPAAVVGAAQAWCHFSAARCPGE